MALTTCRNGTKGPACPFSSAWFLGLEVPPKRKPFLPKMRGFGRDKKALLCTEHSPRLSRWLPGKLPTNRARFALYHPLIPEDHWAWARTVPCSSTPELSPSNRIGPVPLGYCTSFDGGASYDPNAERCLSFQECPPPSGFAPIALPMKLC